MVMAGTVMTIAMIVADEAGGTLPGATKAWVLDSDVASLVILVMSTVGMAEMSERIAVAGLAGTGAVRLPSPIRPLMLPCCWVLALPVPRRPLPWSCCQLSKQLRPLKMMGAVGAPLGKGGQLQPGASPRRRALRPLPRLAPRRRSSGPPLLPSRTRPELRGWPFRSEAPPSSSCARRRP